MPRNRCHYDSSDDSSCESSYEPQNECDCKHCEKRKQKKHCCEKERHKKHEHCCNKNNRCYKKKSFSNSRNEKRVIDYCKNECQDGKVILITIS